MRSKPKIWFVDDLPQNLDVFRQNHGSDFQISTFSKCSEVLERIQNDELPDALLCDVFFYEDPEEGSKVEAAVNRVAEDIRRAARSAGLDIGKHGLGIELMQHIYQHFDHKPPPFPMYAYTSKGPYLLEKHHWEDISQYGGRILLKGRVSHDYERMIILSDINYSRELYSKRAWIHRHSRTLLWYMVNTIFSASFALILGRIIRGSW